ncbi:trypsin-like serine peptidase [Sinomonas mesophila]|uniref:trypsin-like serine peptidase n=1 Tax=Sinomonas mesophila TaxID=1531955 RepID=UPI0009865DA7|nr:endopeptidase [Sinomonas mesophila]
MTTTPELVDDPHGAVSNEPEALGEETVTQPMAEEPSTGSNGEASGDLEDDGAEPLPGARLAELAPEPSWVVPELDLPDIGEASFGTPAALPETVHGPDDRVQISPANTYPWRVHASLLITAADNSLWIGTGWFIGPHTLITAGHVVFIKNSGVPGRDGWVKKIQVMPGRDGSSLPYGSVTSTSFRSVKGWTVSGSENYDYGAIIIPTELGTSTGWFGYGAYTDADLLSVTANISGYPGDKPSGTQWYAARKVASVGPRKVRYDIDTAGGQSGSAVYRIKSGGRYGIAVHAYGGATTNSGTRITGPVFDNFKAWKA